MITGAQQRQLYNIDDDDDALDERGILKDGKGFRASMFMMDSTEIDVAANRSQASALDIQRNTSEREQLYADAAARLSCAYLDPTSAYRAPVASSNDAMTAQEKQQVEKLLNGGWKTPATKIAELGLEGLPAPVTSASGIAPATSPNLPLSAQEQYLKWLTTAWQTPAVALDAKQPTNDAQREPETLADAYAYAEARLCSAHLDPYAAWRDPAPAVAPAQQPTNDGKQEPPATLADAYAAYETRLTTAFKNPPAMAPIIPDSDPQSLLPPPSSMMADERERLYTKRNEAYENAWKNPL